MGYARSCTNGSSRPEQLFRLEVHGEGDDAAPVYTIKGTDENPYQVHVGGKLALTITIDGNSLKRDWAET